MKKTKISMNLPISLIERIDRKIGKRKRTAFIVEAISIYLSLHLDKADYTEAKDFEKEYYALLSKIAERIDEVNKKLVQYEKRG